MNLESLTLVPNLVGNTHVLVHFIGSKTASLEKYTDQSHIKKPFAPSPVEEVVGFEEEEKSLAHLISELDRLEKQCGSFTLSEIFFEAHDGPNAVTNMSARYPDVRQVMDHLYKSYGFDVLYEELEL